MIMLGLFNHSVSLQRRLVRAASTGRSIAGAPPPPPPPAAAAGGVFKPHKPTVEPGHCYYVATPLGNLKDMTARAIEVRHPSIYSTQTYIHSIHAWTHKGRTHIPPPPSDPTDKDQHPNNYNHQTNTPPTQPSLAPALTYTILDPHHRPRYYCCNCCCHWLLSLLLRSSLTWTSSWQRTPVTAWPFCVISAYHTR
jgi:hypothetical protein